MSKRLIVAIEHHFQRYKDVVYTDISFPYEFWREYLDVFDEVLVLARVENIYKLSDHLRRADGDKVSFVDLPNYYGPWKFLKVMPHILARCFHAVRKGDFILLRMGNIANCLWLCAWLQRREYAAEILGDPTQSVVWARRTSSSFIDWIISRLMRELVRLQARGSCCVSYVCHHLQHLYPNRNHKREFVFSDVHISEELRTRPLNRIELEQKEPVIISVGRLLPEKGHKVLIEAAARLKQLRRDNWHIKIVGQGDEEKPLENMIASLNLENHVKLLGVVKWGNELFTLLDSARLFVLPSYTEGMPRALLEAMARGLPAIASRVGGISEVLAEENLVPHGNAEALAKQINLVLDDTAQLEQMSRRNFARAMEFRPENIQQRKYSFWQSIIKYTSVKSEVIHA